MNEILAAAVLLIPALIGFALGFQTGKTHVIDNAITGHAVKAYGRWWTVTTKDRRRP